MHSFFDTSALAKLYHKEVGSEAVERLFDRAPQVLISRLGAVEMYSVISGRIRAGFLNEIDAELARRRFRTDIRRKHVRVIALRNRHYELASSLIEKYGSNQGLRTLDSLQLAVAVDMADNGLVDSFVTADKVLGRVATLENLVLVDPEEGAS